MEGYLSTIFKGTLTSAVVNRRIRSHLSDHVHLPNPIACPE